MYRLPLLAKKNDSYYSVTVVFPTQLLTLLTISVLPGNRVMRPPSGRGCSPVKTVRLDPVQLNEVEAYRITHGMTIEPEQTQ